MNRSELVGEIILLAVLIALAMVDAIAVFVGVLAIGFAVFLISCKILYKKNPKVWDAVENSRNDGKTFMPPHNILPPVGIIARMPVIIIVFLVTFGVIVILLNVTFRIVYGI